VLVRHLQAVEPTALPVDRKTMHITEPLGPDGRVDFAAALNARPLPAPERNAAIFLLRLVGTEALVGDREQTLVLLRAPANLPAKGRLIRRPEEPPFFNAIEDVDTEEERKAFRTWVARNEKGLELLLAASRCPHLAWPFVRHPEGGMLQPALPFETWSQFADLLSVRAELRRVDAQTRPGWRDVEALLRFALLLDESPVLVWRLLATGLRARAFAWVGRSLASGVLDASACADMRRALLALPAPAGLDREVLRHQRLVLLDLYIHQVAASIRGGGGDPYWHPANVALAAALQEINRRFDDVEGTRLPTAAESLGPLRASVEALRKQVRSMHDETDSASGRAEHMLASLVSGGAHEGRLVGTVLSGMVLTLFPMVIEREVDSEAHRRLMLLALALRLHDRRMGSFPVTLEDLEAGLLPDLSNGPFDLAAVSYERDEKDCSLMYTSDITDAFIEIAAGSR